MVYTHNTPSMRAAAGSSPCFCHKVHDNCHLRYTGQTPSLLSDLPGVCCCPGIPQCHSLTTKKHFESEFVNSSCGVSFPFPPSPPPTHSEPKRSVPLPVVSPKVVAGPPKLLSFTVLHVLGSLDSTLASKQAALGFQIPMTPPPTLPTSTQALPPTSDESAEDDFDVSFLGLPRSSTSLDNVNEIVPDPLLSPISPEWQADGIALDSSPFAASPCNASDSMLLSDDHFHASYQYLHPSLDDDTNESPASHRPILPPIYIPDTFGTPRSAWSESPTSTNMDTEMDDDEDFLSTPLSHTLSPLVADHKLDELDFMFDDDDGDYIEGDDKVEHQPYFTPTILPALEDEDFDINVPDSPRSPYLHTLPSLPSDDEDADDSMLISPPSPGATLLSLPGADTDDDLFPADLALHTSTADELTLASPYNDSSASLLLLDDPSEGIPSGRSPSPEVFELDFDIETCQDPDIRRLSELKKKSQAAERAARQLEMTLLEQGAVHRRWETRRLRKKEKERCREIGTMLKLKLSEKGKGKQRDTFLDGASKEEEDPDFVEVRQMKGGKVKSEKKKSHDMNTMEQLVANMLLRRHDNSQSIIRARTPVLPFKRQKSPLTLQAVRANEDFARSDVTVDTEGDTKQRTNADRSRPPWNSSNGK